MTTLKNVIADKEAINALALNFGFTELKVYKDPDNDSDKLVFIVALNKNDPQADRNNDYLLKASLIEKLDCSVDVIMIEQGQGGALAEMYQKSMLDSCVSISDEPGLKKLFAVEELDQVTFSPVSPSLKASRGFHRNLQLARKEITQKKQRVDDSARTEFFKKNESPTTNKSLKKEPGVVIDRTNNMVTMSFSLDMALLEQLNPGVFETLFEQYNASLHAQLSTSVTARPTPSTSLSKTKESDSQ
jgi:hypothetical protein